MDLTTLQAELASDPESMGYARALHAADDAAVAHLLNRRDRPGGVAVLSTGQLLEWAAGNARFERIEAAAANTADHSGVRSIAKAALLLLARPDAHLDLARAEHADLLNALATANVITLADKQALVGQATVPQSRAEELLGRGVTITASDVGAAR